MTIRTLILFGALAASVPASAQLIGPWVVFDHAPPLEPMPVIDQG